MVKNNNKKTTQVVRKLVAAAHCYASAPCTRPRGTVILSWCCEGSHDEAVKHQYLIDQ